MKKSFNPKSIPINYFEALRLQTLLSLFLLVCLTLFSKFLAAEQPPTDPFSEYLNKFRLYPEVLSRISSLEKQEFARIQYQGDGAVYSGDLISLYLLVSGQEVQKRFKDYIIQFNDLFAKIKKDIQNYESKQGNLNAYNKSEFILHLLHRYQFRVSLSGPSTGYNTGISETFDRKEFNCYKSALIYNAVMQREGIESRYVTVPLHIFSEIKIEGKWIQVETTNAFGFDPYNSGYPKFQRVFDRPNIKFPPKQYSSHDFVDNVTILKNILNNRALLKSGENLYNYLRMDYDQERAAALIVMASYLYKDKINTVHSNLLSIFLDLAKRNLERDPYMAEKEWQRFIPLAKSFPYSKYADSPLHNISIYLSNALESRRDKAVLEIEKIKANTETRLTQSLQHYQLFVRNAQKFIYSKDIKENTLYDSVVDWERYVSKYYSKNSFDGIKGYAFFLAKFISNPILQRSSKSRALINNVKRIPAISMYKLSVTSLNARDYKHALHDLKAAKVFLDQNPIFMDQQVYRSIESNIQSLERYLNQRGKPN